MRQVKPVGMMARGRQGVRSAENFPAAGIYDIEKMDPHITEVIETQGLLLLRALPNLLKLVC